MIWHDHSKLRNTHAFCGASNYSWRNYDLEKLEQRKINSYAAPIGTALHEYAASSIRDKFKINKSDKHSVLRYLVVDKKIPSKAIDIDFLFPNLMNYVNDAIGFRMDPEIVLYFSPNCYGTADAISWENGILQISDLKTGVAPANFMQLENYAAFFALDYHIKPTQIKQIIFRIYQAGEVIVAEPPSDVIKPICDQLIEFNRFLTWFDEG